MKSKLVWKVKFKGSLDSNIKPIAYGILSFSQLQGGGGGIFGRTPESTVRIV